MPRQTRHSRRRLSDEAIVRLFCVGFFERPEHQAGPVEAERCDVSDIDAGLFVEFEITNNHVRLHSSLRDRPDDDLVAPVTAADGRKRQRNKFKTTFEFFQLRSQRTLIARRRSFAATWDKQA
jgi:hypothetical protein